MTATLAAEPHVDPAATQPCHAVSTVSVRDSYVIALLIAVAVVPYLATLLYGFVYDDTSIARHNPIINGWSSLLTLWRHPYWAGGATDHAGLYRPVQMAVFALLWNAGRGWALWFHVYAVAIHAGATLAVWWVLKRGVGRWPAVAGAVWFAIHPVHVEAVANVSNTSEVLVLLWTVALGAVLARGSAASRRGGGDHSIGWRTAIASASLFAAAILTKESGVMAPGLALLMLVAWRGASAASGNPEPSAMDFDPRRIVARWWRVVTLWLVVFIAVAWARIIVLGGVVSSASIAAPGFGNLSVPQRMWAMLSLGPRVLALLFWPGVHNPHYGPSTFPTGRLAGLAAASTIVAISLALVVAAWLAFGARRRVERSGDSRPLAALGWILLAFLPASNLLSATGQILAERTLYGASVGAAMLVAWSLDILIVRATADAATAATAWRRLSMAHVAMLGFVLILAACWRGVTQVRIASAAWGGHLSLFRQMVIADPRGYRGYHLLAQEERRLKQNDSALVHFGLAYSLFPRDPDIVVDYASFLIDQNHPVDAARVAVGLMRDPTLRGLREPVSVYLNSMGRGWGADSVLAAATRLYALTPTPIAALYIGLARQSLGDRQGALQAFRDGLRIAPRDSALAVNATELERTLRR